MGKKKIIVGISGASGAVYGIRLLEVLQSSREIETHLILSAHAGDIIKYETRYSLADVRQLADQIHAIDNLGSALSSGSFLTEGMIIAPCSMKTLSGIANSSNDNLLVRAADVCLKEGRKLVLVPRETPLHLGHLELMARVARYGAVLLPPVPAFYHQPETIDDIINHTVGKMLDNFGIEHDLFKRWEGGEI
ncbi:MAG: 3-octaprenyl-4-hydroxybenzoate carboxy-lyase [Deltaproteobacteria bacterium]|nr:MAG: 3-octaprenyl-4-hydroxybenzoate carboxy-lyase [Deltaproteobacteria bacterium]